MTVEQQQQQEDAQVDIGLSVEQENERTLKLGILHSCINTFEADQPPPPLINQPSEVGGSSSVTEPLLVNQPGEVTAPKEPVTNLVNQFGKETGSGSAFVVFKLPEGTPEDKEIQIKMKKRRRTT